MTTNSVPNNVIITEENSSRVVISSDATSPNPVNIHQDTPNTVLVDNDAPNQVIIRSTSASSNSTYTRRHVHIQTFASDEWIISHPLGGHPSVTVVDSANTAVFGEVKYDSTTQVTVLFTVPFSGYAYLT